MNHQHRLLQIALGGIIAISVVVLLLLGVAHQIFSNWNPISAAARIRQHTEDILQAAITSLPTYSSTTVLAELDACGRWLPIMLKRNNNQYSIVIVGVWGNDASPIPSGTGSITAIVHVEFPDGARVEMQYYAYTLDLCRLIKDGNEPP